ncbi:hypothetical protein MLD38_039227 [Melastoma candidum]|uniref:Uncharacterized protein n=1 Tax=Melastoma candidum TaxID=119954 RepID=A0ACB9L1F4_9MYRT|nr:hypothetical protein MLD38_039227 [Melastoma candidum]
MVSEVRRKLESVCCGKGWCYGVFWRFDRRNPMLLTVEDAYCDNQMEALVDNIRQQVQLLGEGHIGQAAFTRKHCWMFYDARNEQCSTSDCSNGQSLLVGDPELHRQFSNGIKTTAVIPVEQKGVLQFGSRKKIPEKLEHLQYLKKPFEVTNNVDGMPPFNSDPTSINGLFASLLNEGHFNSAALPQSSSSHLPSIYSGRTSCEQSFAYPTLPIKVEPADAACISSCTGDFSVITSVESPLPSHMLIRDYHDLSRGDALKNSLVDARSTSFGQNRPFQEVKTGEQFTDNTRTIDDLSQWFADLPGDDFAVMESALNFDGRHAVAASISSSSLVRGDYAYEAPVEQPSEERAACTEGAHEDMFSVGGDCWDDYSTNSCPVDLGGSWKGVLAQLGLEDMLMNQRCTMTPKQPEVGNFSQPEMMNAMPQAMDLPCGRDLQGKVFPKSSIGMWIDDSYSNNIQGIFASRICKTEEPRRATKRRARPGESTRPRPKDRQLIQDRLKELRVIIPNGAKCSIDALLDRTVKHMQFLQDITKYADRLRQAKMPKLINPVKRSCNSSVVGGGATWAFEVGSRTVECPVIVEDLDARGQMLIEMVCEDQGLSLEIADTVRGFGLNILKGEMEVRDGKLWSRFIVEANRHVTRMDVFWSLMRLLQQRDAIDFERKVDPHTDMTDGGIGILHCNDYKQTSQPLRVGLTEIFR